MPFHKYSCGCIGIPIEGHNGDDRAIIVDHCDKSDSSDFGYSMFFRDMPNKTSVILPPEEVEKIVKELGSLIGDGYAMRSLAHTINSIIRK